MTSNQQVPDVAAVPHETNDHAPWPNAPDKEVFYGLAGQFVETVSPHSEADPIALLIQFLAAVGNAVGRSAHFVAEADKHFLNLFVALVGATAKGRKGSSWSHPRRILERADPSWSDCIQSGLSSGEGLIWAVRDPVEKQEALREHGRITGYETVITDHGVHDKRLLIYESEFASTLKVLNREGNTLSALIRQAWETGDLKTLTKNSPAHVTGAHISLVAHITRSELRRYLTETEAGNGFANRFVWACVRRSKFLPEGSTPDFAVLEALERSIRDVLSFAKSVGEMRRDDDARKLWRKVYPLLSEGRDGLWGAVTSRAEAQVMRLACLYALLDKSSAIRINHLRSAITLWLYLDQSARHIFGQSLGYPIADQILSSLRSVPEGLTRTEIRDIFARHARGRDIDAALNFLEAQGLATHQEEETEGRPTTRYLPTATKATEVGTSPLSSPMSLLSLPQEVLDNESEVQEL